MVKKLGLLVFISIAVSLIYRGITANKPHEWQIGIFLLDLVAVTILCVKLFPKQFDSVESGEEGKKFLSHVAKKAAGRIDE